MPSNWAEIAKTSSEIKILDALKEGRKTWSQLVNATGLSKHTLQVRLPKMEERGVIRRELVAKPGKRSRVFYVLSEKGSWEYPFLVSDFIEDTFKALQATRSPARAGGTWILQYLDEEDKNCASFILSHEKQIRNEEELEEHVRAALAYLLYQYIDKPEDLEDITEGDFNLTFRFDRIAATKIMQEREAAKTRLLSATDFLPDADDYLPENEKRLTENTGK